MLRRALRSTKAAAPRRLVARDGFDDLAGALSSYTLTRWISAATLVALSAFAGDDPLDAANAGPDEAPSTALAQAAAPTPSATSGGARNTPVSYDDPDLKCYKFTAFESAADRSAKYSVPTTPDLYVSFNMRAPWSGTQYIK